MFKDGMTITNDTIGASGNGAGSFSGTVRLKGSDKILIRAYATNNNGTGYGNIFSVTTVDSTITDIDNNHYRIVQTGMLYLIPRVYLPLAGMCPRMMNGRRL